MVKARRSLPITKICGRLRLLDRCNIHLGHDASDALGQVPLIYQREVAVLVLRIRRANINAAHLRGGTNIDALQAAVILALVHVDVHLVLRLFGNDELTVAFKGILPHPLDGALGEAPGCRILGAARHLPGKLSAAHVVGPPLLLDLEFLGMSSELMLLHGIRPHRIRRPPIDCMLLGGSGHAVALVF